MLIQKLLEIPHFLFSIQHNTYVWAVSNSAVTCLDKHVPVFSGEVLPVLITFSTTQISFNGSLTSMIVSAANKRYNISTCKNQETRIY